MNLALLEMVPVILFIFLFSPPAHSLLQANQILWVEEDEDLETISGFEPCRAAGEEAFRGEGSSLCLAFDVTVPHTLLEFGIPLRNAALSKMRYLSFWMKTESRPGALMEPEFSVEARGGNRGDRVPGRAFARGREIQGWQKFVIPLERFRAVSAWDRVTEIRLVFKNLSRLSPGRLLLDDFLFGSVYPEGLKRKEIPMQNRVSSFKIARGIADSEMTLKRKPVPLTLTLTFVDPYLEEIRFEESRDEGRTWRRIESFYDHGNGGVYETDWEIHPEAKARGDVLLRATAMNLLGGEVSLAGPYRLHTD